MGPICEICYIVWVQARLSQFIEEKSPKNYKLSEWVTDTRYGYRYRYQYRYDWKSIGMVLVWYEWYNYGTKVSLDKYGFTLYSNS